MTAIRILAPITAIFAYVLVALSPIVRITGSGMGCGDDWPLCNGRLIPALDDLPVMIEWGHRMAAAWVGALIAALAVVAWRRRDRPGVGGRGGVLRPALLAVVLVVPQALLGAAAVRFELPPQIVVVHMSLALALLAVACVAAFRSHTAAGSAASSGASSRLRRSAVAAAGLGAAALLLGALTANLDAGMACDGFPLCNGALWPAGGGAGAHVHWIHRLVAYALVLHVGGLVFGASRRGEPAGVLRAAWGVLAVLLAHVAVAALMILERLPALWRATHAALGAAVWVALIYLAWRASPSRGSAEPDPPSAERAPIATT